MTGKNILISVLLLMTFVSAQYNQQESSTGNPCTGQRFARSLRGCSWYFTCNLETNEVESEGRCPENLYFNETKQLCDHQEYVTCDLPAPPTECPEQPGVHMIPHPHSCSLYTVCFNGIVNDRTCGEGLHFSYHDGKCVAPFLADCNTERITCQRSLETGLTTFHANPRDCQSYTICVGGNSALLRFAGGSRFESIWCVVPYPPNCAPYSELSQPSIPDLIYIDCEGHDGYNLPHPESCEFYFFCTHEQSYLQICGEGQIFDVNTSRCQSGLTATCVTEVPSTGTTTTDLATLPQEHQ